MCIDRKIEREREREGEVGVSGGGRGGGVWKLLLFCYRVGCFWRYCNIRLICGESGVSF